MAKAGASVKVNIYDDPQRDAQRSGQRDAYNNGQRDSFNSEKRVKRSRNESDFVYVNEAYVGSINNLSDNQYRIEPPTTVIREQYWACSRWPTFQKALVVSVGILMGLVVGLAVWLALTNKENPPISDIFNRSHSAPD